MTHDLALYRFTDNQAAMISFLEAVGLKKTLTSDDGSFAILNGAGGSVAVHSASGSDTESGTGETHLVFAATDLDALAGELEPLGYRVTIWDESYGRHAMVSRDGRVAWVNEDGDSYGYHEHAVADHGTMTVVAACFSGDFEGDRAFYEPLGWTVLGHASPAWTPLRRSDTSGIIGLHDPGEAGDSRNPLHGTDPDDPMSGTSHPLVDLGFETSEPLQHVCDRLVAAGFDAEMVSDDYLTAVHVTDPDGITQQIHALEG